MSRYHAFVSLSVHTSARIHQVNHLAVQQEIYSQRGRQNIEYSKREMLWYNTPNGTKHEMTLVCSKYIDVAFRVALGPRVDCRLSNAKGCPHCSNWWYSIRSYEHTTT